jgi:hypothetical protein
MPTEYHLLYFSSSILIFSQAIVLRPPRNRGLFCQTSSQSTRLSLHYISKGTNARRAQTMARATPIAANAPANPSTSRR